MKQDPIFIFFAYLKNKLSGATIRIGGAIMKLKRVSNDLKNKEVNDALKNLIQADQKIAQVFKRTDKFLGRLRLRKKGKKLH